jgi:hypothetical protein
MLSFVVCQQQQLRTRVSPFWVATNSFGAFFELRHSGFSPLCPWQILVRGCFCWALPLLLFALLLCWMAKRISGWGICVSPFVVFLFVVVLCC